MAIDPDLRQEFARAGFAIENHAGFFLNPDSPRHPHSGSGYLKTAPVQDAVRSVVGNSFAQEVGKFVIARDLVNLLENSQAERRQVLIQLVDTLSNPDEPQPIDESRKRLLAAIEELVGAEREMAQVEELKRYVTANLTRFEVERLWRQGVVVCLAAGNEGFLVIESAGGQIEANMNLSIGDPANLDEAISVARCTRPTLTPMGSPCSPPAAPRPTGERSRTASRRASGSSRPPMLSRPTESRGCATSMSR